MLYLITGGAGFIGSNLVESLISDGHEIIVFDNFHTGSSDNLKNISRHEYVNINRGTIRDIPPHILNKVHGIFHLGIPSSAPMYKENQYLIGTTINEFLYLLQNTTAKLVFASSSSVYNGIQSPHNEKAILKVTDFYAETRMAMERLAELYHMLYLNKIIALRLFSVYGEHEQAKGKYANMVTQMLWKMQKHESPVLYGDGSQTRDFIWVGDVVKAFKLAMEKDIDYGVFNIGTGSSYSFNDVITLLNKELGEKFNPTYKENPIKNYVEHTLADMDKTWTQFPELRNTLPFKEGIKHLIKAYK